MKTNYPPTPKDGSRYRALAYVRVSKEERLTGSHTFETQEKRIKEKLDSVLGAGNYDLEILKDDGQSGGWGLRPTGREKKTRPTLRKIQDELMSGAYDVFIVYDLSRLARSAPVFYDMLESVIYPSGVYFLSAQEDIDVATAQGRAMVGMLSVFNGLVRDSIIKRNQDAAATRAEQGYFVGKVGYGWDWEPRAGESSSGDSSGQGSSGHSSGGAEESGNSGNGGQQEQQQQGRGRENRRRCIVAHPKKGKWVLYIKEQYLLGWPIGRITADLNERGVPSPSGKAKWTNAVVFNVMDNPLHAGYIRWKGELIKGEHYERRYYDLEVYEQIQEAREKRAIFRTNTASTTTYLLSGLAFCNRCGRRLYPSNAHGPYMAYRCTTGMNQGNRTCPGVVVRGTTLEETVVDAFRRVAQDPQMQALLEEEVMKAAAGEEGELKEKEAQLTERLAKLDKQFSRWAEMRLEGDITPEQFRQFNEKLLADQKSVRKELQEVKEALDSRARRQADREELQRLVADFSSIWLHLSLAERRQVLLHLLEKLTVDRDETHILVHLKVALLPEETIRLTIPDARGERNKQKKQGVEALTPRQMAVLYYVNQGKDDPRQIAEAMGVSEKTVKSFIWQISQELKMKDIKDMAALARPRINAQLGKLPIGISQDPRSRERQEFKLSPKLMEVFPDLASGATSEQVAKRRGLSKTTVSGRRAAILDAFGVSNIFDAVQQARARGIL